MAIQFARIEIVGRGSGGNACCKGAYNARTNITDEKTNITYNFSNRGDNVHHEILLPKHVDRSFADTKVLMNAIEHIERKDNSQLLKDVVIALPDDKELNLQDRINIIYEIIEEMQWVKNGLAVQMDIHKPHNDKNNWHAHLLITTRRFSENGKHFFCLKARDLNPQFKTGKNGNYIVAEEDIIHEKGKRIINRYFQKLGLVNRVDSIATIAQEHIGPVRMRSVLNQAAERNIERIVAEIEHLDCGDRVLDKVTRHLSIFTKSDLMRAVKYIPESVTKERLVDEALVSKKIIELYQEDGSLTQYFTTAEVRIEEQKILRLSSYVAATNNVFTANKDISTSSTKLILAATANTFKLTEEQQRALTGLLSSNSALQILRGRAGAGKSHVLRQIATIAQQLNINVIGVAPTHKAKESLASDGFNHTDTIKGMLFKLSNSRFNLPKNSLLVVDEAGMISNDDFSELLRVAATRKCTVILSGDERQLASVGRGGMFEVLADKYGSNAILNIQRQDCEWGKKTAMAFAKGEVRIGVAILEQEKRIKWSYSANEAMQNLLADWHRSNYAIDDRIILAVTNKDVAALNHGARQYLKLGGKLTGQEIAVGSNHYMVGDRIVISGTNKDLGVINGDVGVILAASTNKFIISMNNSNKTENRLVEFNPSEFNSFKHGYAVTIFKAQGASIKDVYVYHNGFAGIRNSYVALSRNISELYLYCNKIATSSQESLIRQLSVTLENGSSLSYLMKSEVDFRLEDMEIFNNMNVISKSLVGFYDFAARNITKLTDKYLPKHEYYNYQQPSSTSESVEVVLDRVYEEMEQIDNQHMDAAINAREEKLVVGGNITTITPTTTKPSAKAKFYANFDYNLRQEQRSQENREQYRSEIEVLRREVSMSAESVAIDLLGQPNRKLSRGSTLKYGNNGSLAIKIQGSKAGTWYDFSESKGGDLFDLVRQERCCDFKQAVNYLQDRLGIKANIGRPSLQVVNDHVIADKLIDHYQQMAQEKAAEASKISKAVRLYAKSAAIELNSTASHYLGQVRKIDIDLAKEGLSDDIRTTNIYEQSLSLKLPALLAFARDASGKITGGQQILLDSKTNDKADIEVAKRSFGKIAGSFVEVGSLDNNRETQTTNRTITIIAEGLETALSVRQALIHGQAHQDKQITILCSLGISNIKNYQPVCGEKIIIAADNDGSKAVTNITIDSAKEELISKGAFVEIVRPSNPGDFNDLLKENAANSGEKAIQAVFNKALNKHAAVTLEQYFSHNDQGQNLTKQEKADIVYIQKYQLSELEIVDRYRQSGESGKAVVASKRLELELAVKYYHDNQQILEKLGDFGKNHDKLQVINLLIGKNPIEAEKYCVSIVVKEMNSQRSTVETPKQALDFLEKEQGLLASFHENLKYPEHYSEKSTKLIEEAYNSASNNNFTQLTRLVEFVGRTNYDSISVVKILGKSHNVSEAYKSLLTEYHQVTLTKINKEVDSLDSGKTFKLDKISFNCPIKFLEHLTTTRTHEFFPHEQVQKYNSKLFGVMSRRWCCQKKWMDLICKFAV